ncbi:MAG: phage terminase large subunit [Gammaproteobacteria bacterium]|jgi:hypothetical protein
MLTDAEEVELLNLLEQAEAEMVSPLVENMRSVSIGGKCPDNIMIKGVRGGRGAGAKSWGMTSLLVQECNQTPHRVACLREIHNSLEESVYELVQATVDRLKYPGWKFTKEYIESPCGSHWIFRGLKDLRASRNIKGLTGFTRFFVEEADPISAESWDFLLPTLFRNDGAQLIFCYNQESEADPVTTKIWIPYQNDPDAVLLEARPEGLDNPWWNATLQKLSDKMKETDPDLWEHVYGGKPRSQGHNAVLSRAYVRNAMDRDLGDSDGAVEVGCDPADKGDDKTEIYMRKGFKVIDHKELRKMDGTYIANEIWSMIKGDPSIAVKVDETGIGTSTRDNLRRLGAKVVPINFGSNAKDTDRYPNIVSEMWFDFQEVLPEIDIPDDIELMADLSDRLYDYDSKGRRIVEKKAKFKDRHGRSPDKGDALLLCFYTKGNIQMSEDIRSALANRYKNRR